MATSDTPIDPASAAGLLLDGFERVRESVHGAVAGLDPDTLATQVTPGTNTVAWLVWHLARVQDDHLAGLHGDEQVWTADGWHDRFGLPFDPGAIGYGFDTEQMAQVRGVSGEQLTGYYDAVHERTLAYLRGLTAGELARVVDEDWDPPVTVAIRLVSVLDDDLEHAGQAALVRGMLQRR